MTDVQLLETIVRFIIFDHAVLVIIATIYFIKWVAPKWWSDKK